MRKREGCGQFISRRREFNPRLAPFKVSSSSARSFRETKNQKPDETKKQFQLLTVQPLVWQQSLSRCYCVRDNLKIKANESLIFWYMCRYPDMYCMLLMKQLSGWFEVLLEETNHVEVIFSSVSGKHFILRSVVLTQHSWLMKINLNQAQTCRRSIIAF